jgi:hypothetical protein
MEKVGYEVEGVVDLAVKHSEKQYTFYEIKMGLTAKQCIRLALGQLLEYCHWPDQARAKKLVVVGQVPATNEEQNYISQLRKRYQLPIYYQHYDQARDRLLEES